MKGTTCTVKTDTQWHPESHKVNDSPYSEAHLTASMQKCKAMLHAQVSWIKEGAKFA